MDLHSSIRFVFLHLREARDRNNRMQDSLPIDYLHTDRGHDPDKRRHSGTSARKWTLIRENFDRHRCSWTSEKQQKESIDSEPPTEKYLYISEAMYCQLYASRLCFFGPCCFERTSCKQLEKRVTSVNHANKLVCEGIAETIKTISIQRSIKRIWQSAQSSSFLNRYMAIQSNLAGSCRETIPCRDAGK